MSRARSNLDHLITPIPSLHGIPDAVKLFPTVIEMMARLETESLDSEEVLTVFGRSGACMI